MMMYVKSGGCGRIMSSQRNITAELSNIKVNPWYSSTDKHIININIRLLSWTLIIHGYLGWNQMLNAGLLNKKTYMFH